MKVSTIKIPIYHGELTMILCEKWKEVNEKYSMEISDSFDGVVFTPEKEDGYSEYVVAFNRPPKGFVIAHECVHLVNHIFSDRGIRPDIFNDEPQAYLTGFFFQEIEKFLAN